MSVQRSAAVPGEPFCPKRDVSVPDSLAPYPASLYNPAPSSTRGSGILGGGRRLKWREEEVRFAGGGLPAKLITLSSCHPRPSSGGELRVCEHSPVLCAKTHGCFFFFSFIWPFPWHNSGDTCPGPAQRLASESSGPPASPRLQAQRRVGTSPRSRSCES